MPTKVIICTPEGDEKVLPDWTTIRLIQEDGGVVEFSVEERDGEIYIRSGSRLRITPIVGNAISVRDDRS